MTGLVGAFGGVGTTITLGLSAMARGMMPTTGLVTALPQFEGLGLPEPGDFIVGGHDIRASSFADSTQFASRDATTPHGAGGSPDRSGS